MTKQLSKYYTDSSPSCWGPMVHGIGSIERTENSVKYEMQPRTLDEYALVYLYEGRGTFFSPVTSWREVAAGDVIWLFPGVTHRYFPEGSLWCEKWFLLQGRQMDGLVRDQVISPDDPVWSIGFSSELEEKWNRILRKSQDNFQGNNDCLSADIWGVICLIVQMRRQATIPGESQKLMHKAQRMILRDIESDITISDIADRLCMSEAHLRRLFKRYYNVSPGQYLLNTKISRAKELLERGMPIKAVARQLHFGNVYYFSRIFSRKTGKPPSRWQSYSRLTQ